ncbi:methyltransferase domain-containing protein [Sesbania bispinosa]|nr:methyltransferase domain-containing protein [Sesbania bispinosa]
MQIESTDVEYIALRSNIQITSPDESNEFMCPFNIVDRGSSSSFPLSKRNIRLAIRTVSKRWEITSTYEHGKNL